MIICWQFRFSDAEFAVAFLNVSETYGELDKNSPSLCENKIIIYTPP